MSKSEPIEQAAREAFETWAYKQRGVDLSRMEDEPDRYYFTEWEVRWEGFRAGAAWRDANPKNTPPDSPAGDPEDLPKTNPE